MRNIYILIFCVMTGVAAQAQNLAERDLQGEWKLVSYKDPQATIDAIKGTFVLDADYKEDLTPEDIIEDERNYGILAKQYKVAVITFARNTVTQVIGNETYTGTFTLENSNNVSVITVTTDSGEEEDPAEISIKDNMLYITSDDDMELVYKKK